ncbi:Sec62/63 complex, subunit Sec66 [Xylariaceae sp. FL0594]|nr:Sec62/63 complex, subunit Sec66 [Xylariaceae sp. FL0594]
MFDIDWLSLALPFAYISVLGGSLYTFSTIYRKRKAAQTTNLEPWYPEHLQRDIYLSLLHAEDDEKKEVPKTVIRAALLRRAVEDIRRLMQIRPARQPLNALLQRGSVGEDLSHRLTAAEQEMDAEIRDVINEANALVPGWGQTIFQTANEITANTVLRNRLKEIEARAEEERKAYPTTPAKPKEVEQKDSAATSTTSEITKEDSTKGSVKAVSDDEGVHVELTNTSSPAAAPATGGSKKKKKGKK